MTNKPKIDIKMGAESGEFQAAMNLGKNGFFETATIRYPHLKLGVDEVHGGITIAFNVFVSCSQETPINKSEE